MFLQLYLPISWNKTISNGLLDLTENLQSIKYTFINYLAKVQIIQILIAPQSGNHLSLNNKVVHSIVMSINSNALNVVLPKSVTRSWLVFFNTSNNLGYEHEFITYYEIKKDVC